MSVDVPIIVGPTATGKTYLSLQIAEKIPSEIVSADSRQVYRYMDVGTAKADKDSRERITHRMIDICNPDEYYSAGMYAKDARKVIGGILDREILPVVVGGSGLYISALIDGVFDKQINDPGIRKKLENRMKEEGPNALYRDLQKCDPDYAAKISANDRQRILRSLEVYIATGRPFSRWHLQNKNPAGFKYRLIGLTMERTKLYKRIEDRVDEMLNEGLIDEVKNLQDLGYGSGLNALNTVGYKEVFAYLNDEIDFDSMIRLVKQNSRRYAKRQLTWFRKDKRIEWHEIDDKNDLDLLADNIIRFYKSKIQHA